jgi:hypothetical protein
MMNVINLKKMVNCIAAALMSLNSSLGFKISNLNISYLDCFIYGERVIKLLEVAFN